MQTLSQSQAVSRDPFRAMNDGYIPYNPRIAKLEKDQEEAKEIYLLCRTTNRVVWICAIFVASIKLVIRRRKPGKFIGVVLLSSTTFFDAYRLVMLQRIAQARKEALSVAEAKGRY